MRLFLSCPREAETRVLLDAANKLAQIAGVGLVGIGAEEGLFGFCGNSRPMLRPAWPDGSPGYPPSGLCAAEALYRAAKQSPGLIVVTTGPLTDLALCLCAHPELPQLVERLLVVGGSDGCGNVTPAAERNFYNDPEAAQLALTSGIPIVLFALNTTRRLEHPSLAALRYLRRPEDFVLKPAGVAVETRGTITLGKSVNDLYSDKKFPQKNVQFVMEIRE